MSSGPKVAVLGAGVSGLMAAARLARAGYIVDVYEKAITVGGSAGWYVRGNRTFPTGATIAFGLEEGGIFHSLLHKVDALQHLKVSMMDHPMDVLLPDRKLSIYRDQSLWEKELARVFNERALDVIRFWQKLSIIAKHVESVTKTGVSLPIRSFEQLGQLPKYLVKHPRGVVLLARYLMFSVNHLLKQFNLQDYNPFVYFLNAQLVDAAQTDIRKAALLPSSVALDIYRRGSFAIDGGLAAISLALVSSIERAKGTIHLANPAKQIEQDTKNQKWIVSSRKKIDRYDFLINSTGLQLAECDDEHYELRAVFPENQLTLEEQWGAFRLDVILDKKCLNDCEIEESRQLPFAWQIVPEPQHSEQFGDEYGPVYVTLHQSFDRTGQKCDGEVMLTASVHTNLQVWRQLDQENYQSKKQLFVNAMVVEIEKVIPTFRLHTKVLHSGSPLTYGKYIGKVEVGGSPLTVRNSLLLPKGVSTSWKNVFQCGDRVFPGPGTLSCALSGNYAAEAILRSERRR